MQTRVSETSKLGFYGPPPGLKSCQKQRAQSLGQTPGPNWLYAFTIDWDLLMVRRNLDFTLTPFASKNDRSNFHFTMSSDDDLIGSSPDYNRLSPPYLDH